jgi:quinol monooxygenase YgiN
VFMGQPFTSGNWHVKEGNEEAFVAVWSELANWCIQTYPGAKGIYLIKDAAQERHYLSFGAWADQRTVFVSRSRPRFLELFRACQALCDSFTGSDYSVVVTAENGGDATDGDGGTR